MARSLFITYHFPPNGEVATNRVKALCKGLDLAGFPPEVVTVTEDAYPILDHSSKQSVNDIPAHRLTAPAHPIFWLHDAAQKLIHPKRESVEPDREKAIQRPARKGGWLYKAARCCLELPDDKVLWGIKAFYRGLKLCRERSYSFIISTAPPPTVSFTAYFLSKRTGVPLVLDYRDPWTLTPHPFSGDYWPAWLRKLFVKAEKKLLKHASLVITTTGQYADYLEKEVGVAPEKVIAVSNGYDDETFHAAPAPRQRESGPIRIAHFGSLYIKRDPIPFFRAVEALLEQNPDLEKFLRISFYGRYYCDLSELDSLPLCSRITEIRPHIPYREAQERMVDADILLAFAEEQPMQIPAKVFEYIGHRKPILLLGSPGATRDLIADTGCGLTIPLHDVSAITQALKDLVTDNGYRKYATYDNRPLSRTHQIELLRDRLKMQFGEE